MGMETEFLNEQSRRIKILTVQSIGNLGVGHIGGSLSVCDLLSCLYFGGLMNIDPLNPKMEGRDRFIMSKGHAGPALYAALALKGYFDEKELDTLNKPGSNLPSHCDMNRTTGIDMTTGSLGQGLSCAIGAALGSKIKKDGATIYTIIGDGESQEGQIWEAAMFTAHKKLDNIIAFTDVNKYQIDGLTDEINSLGDIEKKWFSFGWHVQRIDGHDCEMIMNAVAEAKKCSGKPSMIIADTIKGKGVSFIEAAGAINHNMILTADDTKRALLELAGGVF